MTAAQCIQLRDKLKAELQRRTGLPGYGSISGYASSTAFAHNPTEKQKTYVDQGKAIIDNFLRIEDYGDLKIVQENDPIPNAFCMSKLGTEIDRLRSMPKTGETAKTRSELNRSGTEETQSGCRGACTGLCVGTCANFCNGCTGCNTTCHADCANSCSQTCTGHCYSCSGCHNSCQGTCSNTCSSGCKTGCSGCNATCSNGCNGCSGCTGASATTGPLQG